MRGLIVVGAGIVLGALLTIATPPRAIRDDGERFVVSKRLDDRRRGAAPARIEEPSRWAALEEEIVELPEPPSPPEPPLASLLSDEGEEEVEIASKPAEELTLVRAVEELPPPSRLPAEGPPVGRPRLHSIEIWGVRDPATGVMLPAYGLPATEEDDPHRLYFEGEYVLCWQKDADVPVLASTGPPGSNGILGQPGVSVLFGGDTLDTDDRSGARFRLGWWLDCAKTKAIEASYFFLGQRTVRFDANSIDTPVIARPFFNLNTNAEFSELVASPGIADGRLTVSAPSDLWTADLNFRCSLCKTCDARLDFLVGLRSLGLDEGLLVTESLDVDPGVPILGGNRVRVFDRFDTDNQFWGGQFGFAGEVRHGCLFLNGRFLLALGNVHQEIDIAGGQIVTSPDGAVSTFVGGLLAEPSNIGSFRRDAFAVLPELNLHAGIDLNRFLRAYVGYNFLYCSSVARPGDQIDRGLDVAQIPNFFFPNPPPASRPGPLPLLADSDFWVQGVSFGLECRY